VSISLRHKESEDVLNSQIAVRLWKLNTYLEVGRTGNDTGMFILFLALCLMSTRITDNYKCGPFTITGADSYMRVVTPVPCN